MASSSSRGSLCVSDASLSGPVTPAGSALGSPHEPPLSKGTPGFPRSVRSLGSFDRISKFSRWANWMAPTQPREAPLRQPLAHPPAAGPSSPSSDVQAPSTPTGSSGALGVVGLHNPHTVCFMNACMQCMCASPSFVRAVNEGHIADSLELGASGDLVGEAVTEQFQATLGGMMDRREGDGQGVLSLCELRDAVRSHSAPAHRLPASAACSDPTAAPGGGHGITPHMWYDRVCAFSGDAFTAGVAYGASSATSVPADGTGNARPDVSRPDVRGVPCR